MNKYIDVDNLMKDIRQEKIADDVVVFMNNFLEEVEDEDDLITFMFVWIQVAGVALGSLEGSTKEGWQDFMPAVEKNFAAGYQARWRSINGVKDE